MCVEGANAEDAKRWIGEDGVKRALTEGAPGVVGIRKDHVSRRVVEPENKCGRVVIKVFHDLGRAETIDAVDVQGVVEKVRLLLELSARADKVGLRRRRVSARKH